MANFSPKIKSKNPMPKKSVFKGIFQAVFSYNKIYMHLAHITVFLCPYHGISLPISRYFFAHITVFLPSTHPISPNLASFVSRYFFAYITLFPIHQFA